MGEMWECEACGRRFGRVGQSHVCVPAVTVAGYFRERPAVQRAIYDAVAEVLTDLGPVTIEAVGVGILFKHGRTFVELRGRQKWMVLSFMLDERVEHPRMGQVVSANGRWFHFTRLTTPADVDETVRGWLVGSYASSQG